MPDQQQIAPTKDIAPVPLVYRESIKRAADGLPPIQRSGSLPTDQEVLNKTKSIPQQISKSSIPETDLGDSIIEDRADESLDDEGILEEEKSPVIESIKQETNQHADQAKKEVTGEKIQEFDLDNEEDKEFLKSLYKDDQVSDGTDEVVDGKSKSKVSEVELEEKYRPYKEKATEYDALKSNPLASAFIEYLKSGKSDPNEFAREVGFVDIEKMSPEQVMEVDFKNEGLTPEEISQELESFENLSPYEKKKRVNSVKSELIQKRDEKLKTFTAGSEKVQKAQQMAAKVGMAQLDDLIPKMENKKYEGLLITSEMANNIKQYVISRPEPAFDENGQFAGYDIKESISAAVMRLYRDQWKKSLVELGRTIGADKALTARIRPNKKVATSSVIPVTTKTFDEIAKDQADKMWAKRQGKSNIKK